MELLTTIITALLGGAGAGALFSFFKERRLEYERARLHEKVQTYKEAFDFLAQFLADFPVLSLRELPEEKRAEYSVSHLRLRLQVYGRLALVGSQETMDAFDGLYDFLNDQIEKKLGASRTPEGEEEREWRLIREKGLAFLNAAREDLKLSAESVEYKGQR